MPSRKKANKSHFIDYTPIKGVKNGIITKNINVYIDFLIYWHTN